MCYVDVTNVCERESFPVNREVPEPYAGYKCRVAREFDEINREDSVVVIPEGLTRSFSVLDKPRKILWWMSVDNYLASTHEENLPNLIQTIELHLYQSEYARQYVLEKFGQDAPVMKLKDYINSAHGQFLYPANLRKNMALYNPKKGYDALKPVIEKCNWLQWVPILNLTVEETVVLMEAAKIYVDFGNHPGMDRIPREAAADGCCVITNRKGSAGNEVDVPIPDRYKFQDPVESLEEVDALFHEICDDFQAHQDEFQEYRAFIGKQREEFAMDAAAFAEYLLG